MPDSGCVRPATQLFLDLLPTEAESRQHLLFLGVPDEKLPVEARPELIGLVCTLDRLFGAGVSRIGLKRMLREPNAELGGCTPADLMGDAEGIERVRSAVRCAAN